MKRLLAAATALITHVRRDDSRIFNLVRAGAGFADLGWPELYAALDDSSMMPVMPSGRRDDYALAAGADAGLAHKGDAAPIARGVASINCSAVPSRIFDAAENTIEWIVEVAGTAVVPIVRAAGAGTVRPAR